MTKIRSAFGASSWLFALALVLGLAAGCGEERERDEGDLDDDDELPALFDQCLGTEDTAWLEKEAVVSEDRGLETGREIAREGARVCGLQNIKHEKTGGKKKVAEKAIECMAQKPYEVELTDGCSQCYSRIVMCTIEFCINDCAGDSHSQECKDCQEVKGCNEKFYECSGLPPDED